MEELVYVLSQCPLFKNIPSDDIKYILENISYNVMSFKKNEIVAIEGEECKNIGIILKGKIDIKRIFATGRTVTIAAMDKGDIFGEALVFADSNKYPSTIIPSKNAKIMFISKEDVLRISAANIKFMNNIISLLANKVIMLNEKINYISYRSIRQKIIILLLNEYRKQNSVNILLPFNRKEMAEFLGIPRPSLSREMINMKRDGLIEFKGNIVKLLNIEMLENFQQ